MEQYDPLADMDVIAGAPWKSLCFVAAAILLLLLGVRLTAALDPTFLMLDFRDFRIEWHLKDRAQPGYSAKEQWFTGRMRPKVEAMHPFIIQLRIPRIPKAGDSVSALSTIDLDDESTYCVAAYLHYEQYPEGSSSAGKMFSFELKANDQSSGLIPLSMGSDPRRIEVRGVTPDNGQVRIQFRLRAHEDRFQVAWMRSSLIKVKYGEVWECEG